MPPYAPHTATVGCGCPAAAWLGGTEARAAPCPLRLGQRHHVLVTGPSPPGSSGRPLTAHSLESRCPPGPCNRRVTLLAPNPLLIAAWPASGQKVLLAVCGAQGSPERQPECPLSSPRCHRSGHELHHRRAAFGFLHPGWFPETQCWTRPWTPESNPCFTNEPGSPNWQTGLPKHSVWPFPAYAPLLVYELTGLSEGEVQRPAPPYPPRAHWFWEAI